MNICEDVYKGGVLLTANSIIDGPYGGHGGSSSGSCYIRALETDKMHLNIPPSIISCRSKLHSIAIINRLHQPRRTPREIRPASSILPRANTRGLTRSTSQRQLRSNPATTTTATTAAQRTGLCERCAPHSQWVAPLRLPSLPGLAREVRIGNGQCWR